MPRTVVAAMNSPSQRLCRNSYFRLKSIWFSILPTPAREPSRNTPTLCFASTLVFQYALGIQITETTSRIIFVPQRVIRGLVVEVPEFFRCEVRIRVKRFHSAERHDLVFDQTVVVSLR